MLRLFLALNLLFLTLHACKGGYDSCKEKLIDSNAIINESIELPIPKQQKLIFTKQLSKQQKNYKILKHDPFLSLYLIEDKNPFKYPFMINMNQPLGCAAVDKNSVYEGKVLQRQIGLNKFGVFNETLKGAMVLTNSCCALEGLVTKRGVIEKEYLQRFINSPQNSYADLGIRVKDVNSSVVVKSIDPFMKNNPFKKGDCIISLDAHKVNSSAEFMRDVLFAKVGSSHSVSIKRDAQRIKLNVKTQKRYGGGYLSDTFLEQKGLWFSEELEVIKIEKPQNSYGLKLGDKLLQVNDVIVQNQQDVMESISEFDESIYLLFERDDFQFFIHVN